jgi:hypothetical protein
MAFCQVASATATTPGGATDGHRSLIPIMRDIVPLFQAIEFDDPDTLVGTPMSG